MTKPILERFWAKVQKGSETSCWLWQGAINSAGYGHLRVDRERRMLLAHRFSFITHRGPIPPGMVLDHICRVRACVNPWHVEAVTEKTNILRGVSLSAKNARKTTCPNGHAYDRRTGGGRRCSVCDREVRQAAAEKIGPRQPNPDAKVLLDLLDKGVSWREIGRRYGVSDSAVRKWAKKFGFI